MENLGAGRDPAGLIRRHEPQQDGAGEADLAIGQRCEYAIRMGRQCAGDTAHILVDGFEQQSAVSIPALPELVTGELEQRQGGEFVGNLFDHPIDEFRIVVVIADSRHGPGEDLTELAAVGAAEDGDVSEGLPEFGTLCEAAEKFFPDGEDDPHRSLGIIRRADQGPKEPTPHVRIPRQGVEFLQLIDKKDDPGGSFLRKVGRQEGEPAGLGLEFVGEVVHRAGVDDRRRGLGVARRISLDRDEPPREGVEGLRARPHLDQGDR